VQFGLSFGLQTFWASALGTLVLSVFAVSDLMIIAGLE
jgi:hypothetical protein